jgi:prefoldin subunit 5
MEADMQQRLQELRAELEKGRQRLQALDREQQQLRETMLRISGAIQVLEELSAERAGSQRGAPAALQTVA